MAGLGRKVFTRETLGSADVNGYLMDQAVMRFASAAARAAAIPAPTDGMVSVLDPERVPEVFYAGTWRRVGPAPWAVLRGGNLTYDLTAPADWADMVDLSASVPAAPLGREVEVELALPLVIANSGGAVQVRMALNGTIVDGGGVASAVGCPVKLSGSLPGGGDVQVQCQSLGTGTGGKIQAFAAAAPRLRYRFV